MDTPHCGNHFFESGLGSGVLVYIIDDGEPVCLKFCSLVKLKVLFDGWSDSSLDDDAKVSLTGSVSVLGQVDKSIVADNGDPVCTDVVYELQVTDNSDVGAGDVSEESRPENVGQGSHSRNLKSKRSRKTLKLKTYHELEDSDLPRKVIRTASTLSSHYDSHSKKKKENKSDHQKSNEIAQENYFKQNSNHIDVSKPDQDKVHDRKLRSSNRIVKLSVKLPSSIKASKAAKTLLKSKIRKTTVKMKRCFSESIKTPETKSDHAEEVSQQVKERQRKLLIEKTITCEYCMVDFKNQQAFYDHRRVEESVHTCGICGKVEPYEAHLIVHMQKHRRSKSGLSLSNHDKFYSKTESSTDADRKKTKKEKMKCNICGLVVSSMDSLKIHTFLHTGEYAYRCCVCQEPFSSLSSRQHHMDIHISAQRFKCNPCGERFTSRADLAKHQLTHEIKCALCGEIFPNKTSRTCHFRVSHPNDILKCSLCSNLFATMEDLEKHLAYHKKGKKEQCPVCGVVVSKLKDHMMMHSHVAQEKLFACDQCPMRYLRKSNLDRHMRTHTGEKPYACNRCPKSFRSNGMLRKHLLTHTKERPYQCEVCGKQCSLRSNLNIHMRVHNSDRHFSCSLCSQAFNHKNSLHGHMKNKHSQDISVSEMKLSHPANLQHEASIISPAPNMVSEFDKHLTYSNKHFQNLEIPVSVSQNANSDLLKVDKFEKHQDFRQMQSHLDFPVNMTENMPNNLYIDNGRITLSKFDMHPQTSHNHGY